MRDSMKITVRYQFANMLLMHLAAIGVTFVFGVVVFGYLLDRAVWKEMFSVLFMAVYAGMLYVRARKFGISDSKPYTPLKPSKIRGLMFGVVIAAVMLGLFALMRFIGTVFPSGHEAGGVITATVFYFLFFPFNGIMNLHDGIASWYSIALMAAVPAAACFMGYAMGCKNISILEKISQFMYEKK